MILPKERDPRFITIRRGGMLTETDHRLLALWAAACAEHVLPLFESEEPADLRPRQAVEQVRAWVRGEVAMSAARAAGGHAMAGARDLSGAARMPLAARPAAGCNSRAGPGRSAAAKRPLLVGIRLLIGGCRYCCHLRPRPGWRDREYTDLICAIIWHGRKIQVKYK